MTGNDNSLSSRSAAFRSAIASFIDERREAKLKGQSGDEAASAAAKYDYHTWLEDAARRVSQIQAVTHVLKATHPDAKGSSLFVSPRSLPSRSEIGSHLLGDKFSEDIVGNAAALDVYKFLKVEVDGKRLMDWLQQGDEDLLNAMNSDPITAKQWGDAFKSLVRPVEQLSSHTMAKQIYWCITGEPTDDAGFHLLQPLFSSSLAHAVHQEINDARFGDQNKEARQAFYKKEAHDAIYREYKDLAIRKLGGTKPQNISQLNSERGGVNYLLGSLPPRWRQRRSASFLFLDSALIRFQNFENVRGLIKQLIAFLQTNPEPTMETRQTRETLERSLGQSLAAFGLATRHSFEPGWTRSAECHLPLCERIWLDMERAELPAHPDYEKEDQEFREAKEWKDWPDEVASRFANWLNAQLLKAGLPVSDAEYKHWAKQAIIDADWPATFHRRAIKQQEVSHD
jgi:CRISPR-associated protein Csy1